MTEQRLILGESLVTLPTLRDETFDLIVADPPYNLGKDYGNNRDSRGFEEYLEFTAAWLREAYRLLKRQGTIYVFMGYRFISYLYAILEKDLGMHFNSWIVWHYTQGIGKTKGFSPRHDDILMFTKSTDFVFNLDSVRIPQKFYRERNNMRGANPGDVWEFSHVHYSNGKRQAHPTQKPEALIERLVLASSNEGDSVLDPFLGSGTTLRVCQQLKRFGTGIEVNPEYVAMAERRLKSGFEGFDSLDPRMKRIPLNMRDAAQRQQYLRDHERWFLANRSDGATHLERTIEAAYPEESANREQSKLL